MIGKCFHKSHWHEEWRPLKRNINISRLYVTFTLTQQEVKAECRRSHDMFHYSALQWTVQRRCQRSEPPTKATEWPLLCLLFPSFCSVAVCFLSCAIQKWGLFFIFYSWHLWAGCRLILLHQTRFFVNVLLLVSCLSMGLILFYRLASQHLCVQVWDCKSLRLFFLHMLNSKDKTTEIFFHYVHLYVS